MSASTADDADAHFRAEGRGRRERALARLSQTRHYTDVAGECGGIPKSALVTQLCNQAGGCSRADSVNGSKEFSNFVLLKLALDVLVEETVKLARS